MENGTDSWKLLHVSCRSIHVRTYTYHFRALTGQDSNHSQLRPTMVILLGIGSVNCEQYGRGTQQLLSRWCMSQPTRRWSMIRGVRDQRWRGLKTRGTWRLGQRRRSVSHVDQVDGVRCSLDNFLRTCNDWCLHTKRSFRILWSALQHTKIDMSCMNFVSLNYH